MEIKFFGEGTEPLIGTDEISDKNINIFVIEDYPKSQEAYERALEIAHKQVHAEIFCVMVDCKEKFDKICNQIGEKISEIDLFFIDGQFPSYFEQLEEKIGIEKKFKNWYQKVFKKGENLYLKKITFEKMYKDGIYTGQAVIKNLLEEHKISPKKIFSTSADGESAIAQKKLEEEGGVSKVVKTFILPKTQIMQRPHINFPDSFLPFIKKIEPIRK